MFDDMTPRYAPSHVLVVRNGMGVAAPVVNSIAHPPYGHPDNCPIQEDMTALELRTSYGSTWYGCKYAYINGELRMIVVGCDSRDEIRSKWAVAEIELDPVERHGFPEYLPAERSPDEEYEEWIRHQEKY